MGLTQTSTPSLASKGHFGETFIVDHRACRDAGGGERFEDVREPAVLRRRIVSRGGVASRDNGHGMSGKGLTFGHAQAPLFACCAELGPKSHGESACPLTRYSMGERQGLSRRRE